MDGDGKPDEVAVVGHPNVFADGVAWPPGATPIIRVLTVSGIVSYRVAFSGPIFGQLIHGIYNIDGEPGQELLIEDYDGAHGQSETIVKYSKGRLVALPSPDNYNGGTSAVGSWGADGSIMSNLGWHCLPGGRVEEFTAGSNYPKPGYTTSHRTWRWTGQAWKATGPAVTNEHASPTAGTKEYSDWTNCGTFKRFA